MPFDGPNLSEKFKAIARFAKYGDPNMTKEKYIRTMFVDILEEDHPGAAIFLDKDSFDEIKDGVMEVDKGDGSIRNYVKVDDVESHSPVASFFNSPIFVVEDLERPFVIPGENFRDGIES